MIYATKVEISISFNLDLVFDRLVLFAGGVEDFYSLYT